ncbi:MAG: MerR family transcriptional regulator [Burkholderiaceae bacterium]|nr:MAG: MerR family transcriptional regulator [Burkholderiaceae bacterium]
MDIAEVVRQTGVPASTLRYYEELGLIAPLARKGLRRQYADTTIEKISFILLAQSAGFKLAEIEQLLKPNTQGKSELRRELLQEKTKEIAIQIRRLKAIQKSLEHAAVCPAKNHFECPSFQKLMRLALKPSLSA